MRLQMRMNILQQHLLLKAMPLTILQATQRRCENKSDIAIADDMGSSNPRAGLETFECDFLESHTGNEESGGLLCIADVPVDMVVSFV
jgi:hypothetical protein